MRLPRLAPRLMVSLPISVMLLAARGAAVDAAAAPLAAALIGAMITPFASLRGVAATALAAGAAAALWVAHPGAAAAVLAALPLAGNLALAWHFGATLRPGHEPLITRYMRHELPDAPAGMLRYTRRLTFAWTVFFLAFCAVNAATLAGFGPAPGPSGVVNLALAAALFLAEHRLRGALFPEVGPVRPSRTLRTIWQVDAMSHVR